VKRVIILFSLLSLHCLLKAQENRFNVKLDKFCRSAIQSFKTISPERKRMLDNIARNLADKRYVVFVCNTNSRRTQLLQVWAQTAFYYYGLYDKHAFSFGDTIIPVHPRVAWVLEQAGFYVNNLISVDPNGYMISSSTEFPQNVLSSKNDVGTIDTTIGLVVNICTAVEESESTIGKSGIHLPYQSPIPAENTILEKDKYRHLNHQIAVEMLYLGARTRELALQHKLIRF
jgi:hypothetical protein